MYTKKISDKELLLVTNHGHELVYVEGLVVAGYVPGVGHFKSTECMFSLTYLDGSVFILISPIGIEQLGWRIADER